MSNKNLSDEPAPTIMMQTEALRQSEEFLGLLVQCVKDYAIFMLDPDGFVMTWNQGAERIKGYKPEDVIGKHFSVFYTQEAKDRKHPASELKQAVLDGRYEEEGIRVRKDGTTFWANVVITPVRDKTGLLIGFAKVTRDLTERRNAEQERERVANELSLRNQQLEKTATLLAESNDEMQRLAYIISHELQAPISTIQRYSNLLAVRYKDMLGQDANDFLAKMSSANSLIAGMIDDLWTFARITKPGVELSDVDVRHVLGDAAFELKSQLDEDELTVSEMPILQGNRRQLTCLFKELISNAVEYRGAEPPRIVVESQKDGDGYLFSVKDNGIGLDPVHSSEAFRMFHRLKHGPEATSTGMGLATCKKIVATHSGRIWFESPGPGFGTTFFIWLPAKATAL